MTEQIQDWLGYLEEKEDEEMNNTIRSNTRAGSPAGDEGFVQTIEGTSGQGTEGNAQKKTQKA